MIPPESLEGWAPELCTADELAQVVDLAFDYRGDVTVVLRDGRERVGFVANRDRHVGRPFLEMFDVAGDLPVTIRYADIHTIRFTGKDTAAGKSYAAWIERKAAPRTETPVGGA